MNQSLKKYLFFSVFAVLLLLSSCGETQVGGSEAGNPPEAARSIKGKVPSDSGACIATKVVFIDSKDQSSSSAVESDCTFSLNVNKGDANTIGLFKEESFVGIMTFHHSEKLFESNVLVVGSGTGAIDFGQISLTGIKGIATQEPATQNDQDGDGIVDFDDEDDNNNGILDVEERDCDFDGFLNAHDLENSACDIGDIGETPLQPGEDRLLEVLPRNKSNYVSIDQAIKVRASCAVDTTAVRASNFIIGDTAGDHVSCSVSVSSSQKEVTCNHDDFLPEMTYTLTVEGLHCADHGGTIRTVTWHFSTAKPVN